MPAPRRYLWILLGMIGGTLLGIGALNVVADPFRVFGTPRRKGINDRIPNASGFDRIAKPYEVLRVNPRTVLVGSSTAHSGFLPISEWKTALPRPAYNYALLGASVHEVRLSLEQALRECPIEVVLMVADFFAFNAHYRDNERFDTLRLAAATRHAGFGFLSADLFAFCLGNDAFSLSRTTVVASLRQNAGSIAPSDAERDYPCLAHFRNCERSYLDKWFPPPTRTYEFLSQAGCDRLVDFDIALRVCANRGVRFVVICPPIHARFQEALAVAGAWPTYEEWKRQIAFRTRSRQAQTTNSGRLELWDFSLFNEMTCESLPSNGAGQMRFFFDSAHFTPEFGHVILDEILEGTPQFGVRLDQIEIEGHLAALRGELQRFRIQNPSVVTDVRATLGIAKGNISPLSASALGF
jgi:hypothetical protein